ncbi:amino acid ABC transporter substrate-binding protein [Roseateles chitosanitabidus]|jgi:hypothetical protein|uniref:amino acid ABC transporter substrate-binding protein n=1 Tax=Roseateles chitosanitabidus TaxID=65048 RepID=UPI00082F6EC4|nr:amino acid ABC transporter substrate-binding protein [Roseateles chitosanitabidus]MBO9689578.1 amino acid ABC transporter substrate-binding protein [Roseateles chitosanitabidus]
MTVTPTRPTTAGHAPASTRRGLLPDLNTWAAALLLGLAGSAGAATIGVILPASYPSPEQAEQLQLGMTLALKTWPGDAAPKLVVKDSGCDARKAEAASKELIQAKVDVVLGNWCELNAGADALRAAGIPFISSNAERVKDQDLQLQLGRIELNAADRIAAGLRRETGLRISARTSCWMDFDATLSERVDAVLCPVLTVDRARWDQIANTYGAAFRKPFTTSSARGYAAMEVALNYLRRAKGAKPAVALKDVQAMTTLLGPVPGGDAASANALQLVFAPQLPKLSPQQTQTLDKLVKTKGCACPGGTLRNGCPKDSGPWGELPFLVRGGGTPAACAKAIGRLEL